MDESDFVEDEVTKPVGPKIADKAMYFRQIDDVDGNIFSVFTSDNKSQTVSCQNDAKIFVQTQEF